MVREINRFKGNNKPELQKSLVHIHHQKTFIRNFLRAILLPVLGYITEEKSYRFTYVSHHSASLKTKLSFFCPI